MKESTPVTTDPVLKKFIEEAIKFSEKHPEEGKSLHGEFLYWGSAVVGPKETLGSAIRTQIMAIAKRQKSNGKVDPLAVIEDLFSPNPEGEISSDIIMGRLQLWL